jgi:protein-disulfide isomerase/uncharacterized membrane protein
MNNNARRLFWVVLICTLGSIATHVYLTGHHYELKYGAGEVSGLCSINETVNCTKTTNSRYSEFFGVPISIFGALTHLAFLLLLIGFRFPIVKQETQEQLGRTLKLMALGFFAVSVVMGFISFAILKSVCPACTTAYVLSFFTLAATWFMTKNSKGLFSKLDLKLYPIIALSTFALAFIIHDDSMRSNNGKEQLEMLDLQVEEWMKAPEQPMTPVEPQVMNRNPNSKMKIVEFADFLCGHCAAAYPVIHEFVKGNKDVEFSFQAWPLDGECNPSIPTARGSSCLLARLAHCAGSQNKAWETQEWIFKNQRNLLSVDQIKAEFKNKAPEMGLDFNQLISCSDSAETREVIREQAKFGSKLGIRGTPSLFINGRKVPSGFSRPLLNQIYRHLH